jgi:hypothetical protein
MVVGTFNQLQQQIRRILPNRNMNNDLPLHHNGRPHTSLRTREAIAKMACSVLPHPAHSPDLASSACQLLCHLKYPLRGRHFADVNKLKQSFRDLLQSHSRKFYSSGVYRFTQRWQDFVEK